MTYIGVVADTHVPDRVPALSSRLLETLDGVDLILHAGDISRPAVLHELGQVAEVVAVRGNNRGDHRCFDPPLPRKRVVEVDGYRIGLTHGVDNWWQRVSDGLLGRAGCKALVARFAAQRVRRYFTEVDCIVFGHAHWPVVEWRNGCLLFNPGQAWSVVESSVGFLHVGRRQVVAELVPLWGQACFPKLMPARVVWPR